MQKSGKFGNSARVAKFALLPWREQNTITPNCFQVTFIMCTTVVLTANPSLLKNGIIIFLRQEW